MAGWSGALGDTGTCSMNPWRAIGGPSFRLRIGAHLQRYADVRKLVREIPRPAPDCLLFGGIDRWGVLYISDGEEIELASCGSNSGERGSWRQITKTVLIGGAQKPTKTPRTHQGEAVVLFMRERRKWRWGDLENFILALIVGFMVAVFCSSCPWT